MNGQTKSLLDEIKSGKNILYTFAIWIIIENVYIIFLPDFIMIKS